MQEAGEQRSLHTASRSFLGERLHRLLSHVLQTHLSRAAAPTFCPEGDMIVVTRREAAPAAAHTVMRMTAKNGPSPKSRQHKVEQHNS